jgi:hypothetical protein
MKLFIALLTIAAAIALSSCETIESEDGTRTTRWDAKATTDAITTGLKTWEQIDRQSRIIGYDAYGNPIYRQY